MKSLYLIEKCKRRIMTLMYGFYNIWNIYQMKRHLPKKNNSKGNYDYELGPNKIKDGLFMGDQIAAKDMDFITSNKITHIINTVVKKVPNLWEKYGIFYLSVHWSQKQKNIFDKNNQAVQQILAFIQEAEDQGECVLIHSVNGKSRAATVVAVYFMKKLNWSLQKSIEYISSKKQNLKIRDNFMQELRNLQSKLKSNTSLSQNWELPKNEEDLLIANTFKNTQIPHQKNIVKNKAQKRVRWRQKTAMIESSRVEERSILTSQTKYLQFSKTKSKLKGILKGDSSRQEEEQEKISEISDEKIPHQKQNRNHKINDSQISENQMARSQIVGGIRGNYVNVSLNNYTIADDSALRHNHSMKSNNRYNSIQDRDTRNSSKKQMQKKIESKSGSRLMPYQNIISSFRSPYDSHFMSKIGSNTKNKYKEESTQNVDQHAKIEFHAPNQRPSSLGNRQVRKPKTYAELLSNSGVKKSIFSNREHTLRYK